MKLKHIAIIGSLFPILFGVYKNFTAIDQHTTHERQKRKQEADYFLLSLLFKIPSIVP